MTPIIVTPAGTACPVTPAPDTPHADAALAEMGAAKVKPLVWKKSLEGEHLRSHCEKDGSAYSIIPEVNRLVVRYGPSLIKVCGEWSDAKAAAQADYEARILAAIEPAPQEPEKYTIGDLTMDRVFQAAELTNVSDMQAVFDQVEVALRHAIKPAPVSVREAGEGDDSTPVDVSDKTKTTYFDSVPAIEAEMKLHKGRE